MSQNGIRYTDEFKKQLVDLYQAGSSVRYLSRVYGVSNVTIYKWIKEFSPVKVSQKEEVTLKEYENEKLIKSGIQISLIFLLRLRGGPILHP